MKATRDDLPPNILRRIDVLDDQCWSWTGGIDRGGYGRIKYQTRTWRAHRLVYLLIRGELPDKPLDHLCRNRSCVNPEHLEPVTPMENVRRSLSPAGATLRGICQRGHDVTRPGALARGECVQCHRLMWDRWIARKVAEFNEDPSRERHGRTYTYNQLGCRCDECRAYVTKLARRRAARARQDRGDLYS